MESFLQRFSSIVSRNRSPCSDDDIDEQQQFQYLAERRRSAPDIQRNRLFLTSTHKGISDQELAKHVHTHILSRKHFNSTGKLSLLQFFI